MHTRREFIKGMLAASALLGFQEDVSGMPNGNKKSKGILLGTLQKEMTSDPQGTLRYLSQLGYQSLEYPSTFGHSPKELKKWIKKNDLVSLAGGDAIANIKKNFKTMVTEYHQMDKQYLICYWPWMDDGKNKTLDDWKRNAEVFNDLGRDLKKEGLQLAYHNHEIEFIATESEIPYDILLKNTDPHYVTFQIDLWWVVKGNKNPFEYLKNYPGRFELCHIKTADVFANTEVVVEYGALLPQAEAAGCKHFIIENEMTISNPMDYAKKSMEYLNIKFK